MQVEEERFETLCLTDAFGVLSRLRGLREMLRTRFPVPEAGRRAALGGAAPKEREQERVREKQNDFLKAVRAGKRSGHCH